MTRHITERAPTPCETAAQAPADAATGFPRFVSAGDMLTDLIAAGPGNWLSRPGGAGWNVARAVATLGISSACAAAIGTDCFSDALWSASAAAGLDLRFVQRCARPPLLAIVERTDPPAYFFMGTGSADLAFDPLALPQGWRTQVQWAHFGCISLCREPLAGTLMALAEQLHADGVKISYDPNYRTLMAGDYLPTLRRMSAVADLIKVSDEDLRALLHTRDEAAALQALRAMHPGAQILLTRGSAPASLWVGTTEFRCAPPLVAVADTVGAGDAAVGGFLFSLLAAPQRGWHEHLAFAMAAGAAACRVPGAHAPALDEVQALLAPGAGTLDAPTAATRRDSQAKPTKRV